MIKRLLIVIFYICFFSNVRAQLDVVSLSDSEDSLETLENLIVSELFGCNIDVSNIDYTGSLEAIGGFNYIQNEDICAGEFGLDRGVLMTTGLIDYAVGPNNDGDNSQSWNTEYVDDFLHNYLVDFEVISSGVNLYDASVLEFDIESSLSQSINFEVIFGSEEYTEWMSPYYADAFCFFVSELDEDVDPNFNSTPRNIMETGDVMNATCDIENKPISVWTIRPSSQAFGWPAINDCLYIDNENGDFCDAIGYDGYTTSMLFNFDMLPEAKYHIKMIILDGGGTAFDSGVFLKRINPEYVTNVDFTWTDPEYNNLGATVEFSNMTSLNFNGNYFWDFNNDGVVDSNDMNPIYTFQEPGVHIVTLEVVNECTGLTTSISYEIVINAISLDDNSNFSFSIFPNPTSDKFYITLDNTIIDYSIELIDLSGRIMGKWSSFSGVIDVSKLNKGVYYINIRNNLDQSIYFEKVVIL